MLYQVLRKGKKGPQIDDAETFTVDWKFKDKCDRPKAHLLSLQAHRGGLLTGKRRSSSP